MRLSEGLGGELGGRPEGHHFLALASITIELFGSPGISKAKQKKKGIFASLDEKKGVSCTSVYARATNPEVHGSSPDPTRFISG